jgi:replication-associated recombination protein RarA
MPPNLAEKYQPDCITEFVGLARPRALLSALAESPYSSAWLLVGPSGLGKTTMVLALQKQIGGQLHHIPSRKCDLATVESVVRACWYTPMMGRWHAVLVDEADKMTIPAQLAFLSVLDATASPPDTIFFFTANSTRTLEDRFRSRCRLVRFTTEGLAEPAEKLLARIWKKETKLKAPDFAAILRESGYNVRSSLMALETEMIAPSTAEERIAAVESSAPMLVMGDEAQRRSDAAKRAWVTIRARRAGKRDAA